MTSRKAFFSAFLLTLCGVLLAVGLLTADVNTRAVTFDDSTPPYMQKPALSAARPLPAHWKPLYYLWQAEHHLCQWLFEKI